VTGCLVSRKVYGIMAANRTFVAMMDHDSEVARLAERHDIGVVVRPGDDAPLAFTIEKLASRPKKFTLMGLKARQLVLRCFDRKNHHQKVWRSPSRDRAAESGSSRVFDSATGFTKTT
jgi:hypothetical protein